MRPTRKSFLLRLLTGPIHMAERTAFGIEEFHMIQRTVINPYYSWFSAPTSPTAGAGALLSALRDQFRLAHLTTVATEPVSGSLA